MSEKEFFGDDLLLSSAAAKRLYEEVRGLPIIDYHCHLDENAIKEDRGLGSLGELWLSGDHYKWRAMRLCGVDEKYITGDADYHEKFTRYAGIFPLLCGSPLYYFSQLELKILFGIKEPLSADTAREIEKTANEKLSDMTVRRMINSFGVKYIATTDDPVSDLSGHGKYGNLTVSPTFRPDRVLSLDGGAVTELGRAAGINITCLDDLKEALIKRLDYFVSRGCRITDRGSDFAPGEDIGEAEANKLYSRGKPLTPSERAAVSDHLLYFLAGEYEKRGLVMQLHLGTFRNVNSAMFASAGRDAGFDVARRNLDTDRLAGFLDTISSRGALPKTVLYSLDPGAVPALAVLSGAFRKVYVGAAWWFNDTLAGIRRQLNDIAEYAVLGTSPGMLTDSRSFASYARFDFFRRILADYVGGLVTAGEYDEKQAAILMRRVCYGNAKEMLEI